VSRTARQLPKKFSTFDQYLHDVPWFASRRDGDVRHLIGACFVATNQAEPRPPASPRKAHGKNMSSKMAAAVGDDPVRCGAIETVGQLAGRRIVPPRGSSID
jgi:hypothetical protein